MLSALTFAELFGFPAEAAAQAPGRVNLLGEHTDYNDGFVLPTAIPQQTAVELARSRDGRHHFVAADLGEQVACGPNDTPPAGFASYVYGCLRVLAETGCAIPPLAVRITSNVPMGAGLSSSAALEVAVLRGVRRLLALSLDDVQIAQLAQQAEIRYAQVNCGIMDQMASSLADAGHMLFLDTRTLARKLLPLPAGSELLVLDSGVPRSLADSMYNQRRGECEEAARRLGVPALRDVADLAVVETLPPPLAQRARHVVRENARVLEAAGGIDAPRFGALMRQSHASLRDDFAVSVPPLDLLVDLLNHQPAVFGARLTGAGFGGACVALVETGTAATVADAVLALYGIEGQQGSILVQP